VGHGLGGGERAAQTQQVGGSAIHRDSRRKQRCDVTIGWSSSPATPSRRLPSAKACQPGQPARTARRGCASGAFGEVFATVKVCRAGVQQASRMLGSPVADAASVPPGPGDQPEGASPRFSLQPDAGAFRLMVLKCALRSSSFSALSPRIHNSFKIGP
jgi:hypothetical protein